MNLFSLINIPENQWSYGERMTPTKKIKAKGLITHQEGRKNFPYSDTLGNITIGIGYNLTARGLPDFWIDNQFDEDYAYFDNFLSTKFPWYKNLTENRQIVLLDMCFNLGQNRFLEFHNLINAAENNNDDLVIKEMLDSSAARELPARYQELATIWRTNQL